MIRRSVPGRICLWSGTTTRL